MEGFTWIEGAIVAAIIAILVGVLAVPFWHCPAKWEKSGMHAEFHLIGGCQVQRKDGTWVPDTAVRDISL